MVQFSSNDERAQSPSPTRPPTRGSSSCAPGVIFTPQSVNRLLPLVGRIAQDLIALWHDQEAEAAQIRGISSLPKPSERRSFNEELACVKEAFRLQSERLASLQRELADLGVLVDSLREGAFDFPAYLNSRPIRLCWKLGEPEVLHWHGVNESFCHRRPLGD